MPAFLRVDDWMIRTHGISSQQQWLEWINDACYLGNDKAISLNFVPKSTLRRGSKLTNLTLDTALELTQNVEPDYLVFASQHGEITRSVELLNSISRREDLSPIAFSQSVHNTAVGQYTIIKNSTTKATAMAAGEKTIFMALAEAFAFLKTQPKTKVLLVLSDEQLPKNYQKDIEVPTLDYSFGFILSLGDSSENHSATTDNAPKFLPIPLRFLFNLHKSQNPNQIFIEDFI